MAFWGEEAIVNMVPNSKLDVAIFSLNKNSNLPLDNDTPRELVYQIGGN